MNEDIYKRADEIQDECHAYIDELKKMNKKITHQDGTNVWLFHKLAQLEVSIEMLKEQLSTKQTKSRRLK